ncbi:hypothetical protein FQN50_007332 [Emmonsiellopsis sp. PD_5]|nr:hypothetical protein FQN50_007332 [Emmonsiellopsis sp. PD_5]
MFSLRAFTRSVPRTVSRSIATSARLASKPSIAQSTWMRAPRPFFAASFSTTRSRWQPAGQSDFELAAKLQEEMSLETESEASERVPEAVQYYLDNSPFELQTKAGEDEVVLTRKFGDEKIRVAFTISDLQDLDESAFDNALSDEDMDTDAINRPGKEGSFRTAPEDKISAADQEGEFEGEEPVPSYPARVSVTIEKPGKGAMQIETIAQDGMIQIQNVAYFSKPELAIAATVEKEFARQALYGGPPFGNLDTDLQTLMERYLEERGVDAALANFVPDYIEFKEQNEYVNWLGNVKKFVEA